jgi:hypothetical protein
VVLPRLCGPLNALFARGVARRAEGAIIELLLDPREASEGGMVSISMRVLIHCPRCSPDATRPCDRCEDRRTFDEAFSAWLAVPPGVADGALLLPSALLPGMIHPVSFRVRLQAAA